MATLSLRRKAACALAAAGAWIAIGIGSAQAAPSENEVKAAFLYNFARYVTWPDGAFGGSSDPIRICVVGDDGFLADLAATVDGKKVGARPVRAESRGSASRAGGCHILFLRTTDAGSVSGLARSSVFVVSDTEGFAADGGTANFLLVDNKVRFEINPGAVERAGLQVSARLLRLAQIVE